MEVQSLIPDTSKLSVFLRGLPLAFETVEPTRVVGSMELGPDQHAPWGVVHGGACTTAIESAASLGASLAVRDRGQFAVGVNNNTDFLRVRLHLVGQFEMRGDVYHGLTP